MLLKMTIWADAQLITTQTFLYNHTTFYNSTDAIIVIDADNSTSSNGSETRGFLLADSSSSNNNNSSNSNSGTRYEPSGLSSNQIGMAFSSSPSPRNDVSGRVSFPAGMRFKFANVLRLIEGCLAVTTSFILIIQSHDVIELFM